MRKLLPILAAIALIVSMLACGKSTTEPTSTGPPELPAEKATETPTEAPTAEAPTPVSTDTPAPTDTPEPTTTTEPAGLTTEELKEKWGPAIGTTALTIGVYEGIFETADKLQAEEIDSITAFGEILAEGMILATVEGILTEWEPPADQVEYKDAIQGSVSQAQDVLGKWLDKEITSADVRGLLEDEHMSLQQTIQEVMLAAQADGLSESDISGMIDELAQILEGVSGETDSEQPSATPAEVEQSYLGDVVEQYGYLLSAIIVEDPATNPGIFYEPEEGKKLIGVEFIVGNISGETFSSNVLYATLVDSEGFTYGAESGAVENSIQLLDIQPGEKARGWAGFIVEDGAIPVRLKYAIRGSSGKTLQVGLTAREEGYVVPEFAYSVDPSLPKLGEAAEGFDYSLTALTVEDPATNPGYFYDPKPGKKLVAVEFIVGNVSGETFSSNVLYAVLVDDQGFVYGAESGAVDNSIELLDVAPGEKVKGWAGFIVPEGAIPTCFKYAFRGSASDVLQVRLAAD